jgi:putative membrane protein
MSETGARFEVEPSVSNHFAWLRTQMALQRTLMAAVRTAVSLIGFGFTVAQFFQRLQGSVPSGGSHMGPETPRDLGLLLIGTGVVSLSVFTWQFRSAEAYLRGEEFAAVSAGRKRPMRTSIYLIAFTVILIGVAAFGSVLVRL